MASPNKTEIDRGAVCQRHATRSMSAKRSTFRWDEFRTCAARRDRLAKVLLPLALLIASSEISAQRAYDCLLELRAIDDQADTAIRKPNAEKVSQRHSTSPGRDTDALNLVLETQRAVILDQQHAALNAVRSRCYPHRAGE